MSKHGGGENARGLPKHDDDQLGGYIHSLIPQDVAGVVYSDDVAQEARITFHCRHSGAARRDAWPLLKHIARAELSDVVRAARARKRGGRANSVTGGRRRRMPMLSAGRITCPRRGPLAEALHQETIARVQQAISTLPPSWRLALALHDDGVTRSHAALRLGCSEGALKRLLDRTRAELRILLAPWARPASARGRAKAGRQADPIGSTPSGDGRVD